MDKILSMQAQNITADDAKASNWSWWACAGGHGSSEASLFGCA